MPAEKETLIIIEEPESHLHPAAHGNLAERFVDSYKEDSNKRYLIETHSQNFVLRLRRLVAQGKLKPEELAIYYVDFKEEEYLSELKPIKVNLDGSVNWWPDGVFGETIIETRAIMSANVNNLRNVD
jgi:predicted ATPase